LQTASTRQSLKVPLAPLLLVAVFAACSSSTTSSPPTTHPATASPSSSSTTPTAAVSAVQGCAQRLIASRLSAVTFLSAQLGLGLWEGTPTCGNRLVRTNDGGRTWKVVGTKLPFEFQGLSSFEPTMLFPIASVGYISDGGATLMTSDGGRTWTGVVFPGWARVISRYGSSLWAFVAPCAATAVCRYQLEATTLDGHTWQQRGTVPLGNFVPLLVERLDAQRALAAIGQPGAPAGTPSALLTTDGGLHWSAVAACAPGGFAAASFAALGPRLVWVLCNGGGSMSRALYSLLVSADGGSTWHSVAVDRSLAGFPHIPTAPGGTIAATTGKRLWLANYFGLYESKTGGRTWRSVIRFAREAYASEFTFFSSTLGWLFVPTVGLWMTSNGRTWRSV
jgi:photosystem II stability/assembly factor-like uncharacterized protein